MATFHVYVEGPVDRSPAGARAVAEAISQRYGLPVADLITRLQAGRFRVKANVDRVTAEAYVRALQEVGATATIESATGPAAPEIRERRTSSGSMAPLNTARSSSPSQPPPVGPRSGASSLPPANAPRPASTSLPPITARTVSRPSMQSGLAAAYTQQRAQSEGDFGALRSDSFSLSSLDGNDEGTASEGNYAPPPEVVAPPVTSRTATASKPAPLDLFRPPDAEDGEQEMELHTEEVADRAKNVSLPPVTVPVETPVLAVPNTPAHRRNQAVSIQPPTVSLATPAAPRGRFVAGVVLSILLGFVPAHVVAAARETSAFNAIDAQTVATQNNVSNQAEYAALDGFRTNQLAKKQSERRNIALMALVIWAVVGGGIAYAWFTKVPWDKLVAKSSS